MGLEVKDELRILQCLRDTITPGEGVSQIIAHLSHLSDQLSIPVPVLQEYLGSLYGPFEEEKPKRSRRVTSTKKEPESVESSPIKRPRRTSRR
jgi:hypothetical protein